MRPESPWPPGVVNACRPYAARAAAGGATHPTAAALLLAARAHTHLNRAEFAARYNLDIDTLAAIEAGDIALRDLRALLDPLFDSIEPADWLTLTDTAHGPTTRRAGST
ncbi:MAG: hypothetical protein KDB21_09115 [Acidimicrobiales bacterium]|nr:hypothetical protein [Acidimicrobiales bacterium]